MKTWLLSTGVIVLIILFYVGCSNSINNSVTFQNMADADVYVNFRGSVIDVASGQKTVINNIPKGNYNYSTTYTVPAGATGSATLGNLSGTVALKAGTKIFFLYSSTLLEGTYTISLNISSSDSVSTTSSSITLPRQNEHKSNTTLTGP
jgi:hypothetical protein